MKIYSKIFIKDKDFFKVLITSKGERGVIEKESKNNGTIIKIKVKDANALRIFSNFVFRQIIAYEKIQKLFS